MINVVELLKDWFSNYFEKRRRKQTLKIIKKAKQAYLDGEEACMCHCFKWVEPSFLCYRDIVKRISEFKPSTFGLHDTLPISHWWDISDRESRIKAFDKLIEIYSK